ncbi:MAG: DUF2189 domain-containing protein [Steroidobacteraceae bacterium]
MNATLASGEGRNLRLGTARVSPGRPLTWLCLGWMDMRRNWGASLGYGALTVAFGWTLLVFLGTHPYYVAAAISGVLLVAPVMSAGFAEMSRRYSSGQTASFDDSLDGFSRNHRALFWFGAVLALCAIVWFAISAVMLDAVFHIPAPDMQDTLYRGFVDSMNRSQVEAYVAVGGVLAGFVFMLSVVTVPLIIDRQASAGQAMLASVKAVFTNIPAMILWSALILILTIIGYAPLLGGLLIVSPLLGHATWHAYRDLIR